MPGLVARTDLDYACATLAPGFPGAGLARNGPMESGMIGIPTTSPTTIRTRTALAGARTLRARAPDSPSPPSPRLDAIERGIPMSTPARSRLASAAAALLVALPALIVLGLGDAPPADAQKKKVLNIAAKETDTLDPHT